ncbi:MAG: extracellular solute-binding protein [Candidatus Parvarchaeota archaeon]
MNKITKWVVAIVVVAVLVIAGAEIYSAISAKPVKEVVVYADYSPSIAQPYFNAFTNATGIKVVPVYGSMGDLVGKLIASAGSPSADVLFGGAPSAYIAANASGIFQPYTPAAIANQSEYIGPNHNILWRSGDWTWYPFTFAVIGLSINTHVISNSTLANLTSWYNLTSPQFKGKIILENPATSTTTGLAVYSLIWQYDIAEYGWAVGNATFHRYMHALENNSVTPIQSDDENAEVALGTAPSTGPGITFDWSYIPTLYHEEDGYPLVPKLMNNTIIGPTAMAIIKGAPHMTYAKDFVNWVLSIQGQKELGVVFHKPPVIAGVPVPAGSYSLTQMEKIAFPYSQTFTSREASNITAIFNEYAPS